MLSIRTTGVGGDKGRRVWDDGCGRQGKNFTIPMPLAPCPMPHAPCPMTND
ncbi:MAG: histidine kinase [Heteroscytonema crispum UTEX LB 1556]